LAQTQAGGLACTIVSASYDAKVGALSFELDIALVTPSDAELARELVRRAVLDLGSLGLRPEILHEGFIPPLAPTAASLTLLDIYRGAAREVGLSVSGQLGEGQTDAGWAAQAGVPVLCGIGPVGGLAHQPGEFIDVHTLVPRAQAAALTALRAQTISK
jgi:glutamate carboxypeptidase